MSKTRFPRVYDMAIRCNRMQVEAPGNRVLETRFPIGLFQILKSVSNVALSLSLTLTPTHTPTPTPSHSQTRALSLSHKPTHSHRISLTHATVARPLTLSASLTTPSLILSLSQPHTHTLSLSHKPKHSHRVSLTHATVARPPTLSASPMLPSLILHIFFKISEF